MDIVALRLANQHLVSPQFASPVDVVSHMGAVQGQDYRMMRWAVAMRTVNPSMAAFKEAYDSGRIVRRHLMRGTWQLVTDEDYWAIFMLCCTKAKSVINGWMAAHHISIDDDEFTTIRNILVDKVEQVHSATKDDFDEALLANNIKMDALRLSYHVRFAELEGVFCSGDLLPREPSYALAEEKIKKQPSFNRDEALYVLARKYFQSHSPASFEDFVWWTGLNISDCKRAVSMLDNELQSIECEGVKYYIHSSSRNHFYSSSRNNNQSSSQNLISSSSPNYEFDIDGEILLPPYDEYLIGYKSRHFSLPDSLRSLAHNNSGNFYPVVLRNGIVCDRWNDEQKKQIKEFIDIM